MEILRLLDQADWIESYEVQDYRQWEGGFYYRLKITFENQSLLFVREYVDETERAYSYHWQDQNDEMIMRWDNAPHHQHIATFPHHKHTPDEIFESTAITLPDALEVIHRQIYPASSESG
jgi:hypothetical protein